MRHHPRFQFQDDTQYVGTLGRNGDTFSQFQHLVIKVHKELSVTLGFVVFFGFFVLSYECSVCFKIDGVWLSCVHFGCCERPDITRDRRDKQQSYNKTIGNYQVLVLVVLLDQ